MGEALIHRLQAAMDLFREMRRELTLGRRARFAWMTLRIPLVGSIPAGFPGPSDTGGNTCLNVDASVLHLPNNARTFALRVRGDSMVEAGIFDGDHLILEFREPQHGDIVAALIDGETTLKRYVVHQRRPYLKAENPRYPDLIPAQELVIQGVMVALLRVPHGKPPSLR